MGTKAGVEGGVYDEQPSTYNVKWLDPRICRGCPFLKGLRPTRCRLCPPWKAAHGRVADAKGNGEAGSATVTYAKGGDYTVTLTLANSIASAQRTFSVIKVSASGIGTTEAAEVKTTPWARTQWWNSPRLAARGGCGNTAGVMQVRKAATLNAVM